MQGTALPDASKGQIADHPMAQQARSTTGPLPPGPRRLSFNSLFLEHQCGDEERIPVYAWLALPLRYSFLQYAWLRSPRAADRGSKGGVWVLVSEPRFEQC